MSPPLTLSLGLSLSSILPSLPLSLILETVVCMQPQPQSKPLPLRLLHLCALRYSSFLSSFLCAILHCIALLVSPLLSSHLHLSSFFLSFFLFLYLHPSHSTCSYLYYALLRSAPLFGKILYTPSFFAPELSALQLLVKEDSDAPSAPGLPCLGLFGFEGEDREEGVWRQRSAQVRASSSWRSKGFKVVAVVANGFPSRVMPWDLRAFRLLELETFSHFSPPSGAALILVPAKATGHQWLYLEEWTP